MTVKVFIIPESSIKIIDTNSNTPKYIVCLPGLCWFIDHSCHQWLSIQEALNMAAGPPLIASQGQLHPPPFLPVIKSTTTTTHTFRICTDQTYTAAFMSDKRVGIMILVDILEVVTQTCRQDGLYKKGCWEIRSSKNGFQFLYCVGHILESYNVHQLLSWKLSKYLFRRMGHDKSHEEKWPFVTLCKVLFLTNCT